MKISKELLSEIMQLGILEVGEVDDCYLSFNYYILDDDNIKACINVYELAHKCKEWIINKGYVLKLCYVLENDTRELCFIETTLLKSNQYSSDYYDMDSKTEVEAVIKASEWILKGLKK